MFVGSKQAMMTLPSFLSGLEMKSAVCDGPNGMRFPHGPGLVPPGDPSLAPLPSIRRTNYDGLMLTLPALLFHNGLPNLPQSLIEPHRNRAGVWRIKFSYEAGEPLSWTSSRRQRWPLNFANSAKSNWLTRSPARLRARRVTPRCESLSSHDLNCQTQRSRHVQGAKRKQELKKQPKAKIKTIAAAPSQKTSGWQPTFGSGKMK